MITLINCNDPTLLRAGQGAEAAARGHKRRWERGEETRGYECWDMQVDARVWGGLARRRESDESLDMNWISLWGGLVRRYFNYCAAKRGSNCTVAYAVWRRPRGWGGGLCRSAPAATGVLSLHGECLLSFRSRERPRSLRCALGCPPLWSAACLLSPPPRCASSSPRGSSRHTQKCHTFFPYVPTHTWVHGAPNHDGCGSWRPRAC